MKTKQSPNWQKLILELLVVFLGVSGGFVLNNKREEKKSIDLEENYIQGFLNNVDSNIVELENIIASDTVWLKQTNDYISRYQEQKLPIDSVNVIINMIANVSNLDMPTNTYEDIKYSGNLNIIRDYRLKEKIVNYHSAIDGLFYINGYYNSFFSDFILPFVFEKFSFTSGLFFDNSKIVREQFINIAYAAYSVRQTRSDAVSEVLEMSKTFKKELTDYIND